MLLAKEITKWDVEYRQPNHTYLMTDSMDKIIGYFKWNNPKEFTKFKNPIRFDTRYRKFQVIQRYEDNANKNRWKILGSKDHVYYVEKSDDGDMSCTCIGYKYHGKCKHIDEVIRNESK